MLRERILRILLSVPRVSNLIELAIAVFIKKISLIDSLKLQFSNFRATNKFTNSEYFPTKKFHWIIQISAPSGPKSKLWGDTYFAEEIAHSLIELDQEAEVVFRNQNILDFVKPHSIILNIRGLLPMTTVPGKLNLIWVISHPGQISKRELKKYDLVFAASTTWALQKSLNWNMKITPLLQATNPEIFNTKTGNAGINKNLLFIGNTRGIFRKSVKVANTKAKNLEVIGTGWQKFLPEKKIKQEFLDNSDLSSEYREAEFVLSDHWDDMAKNGFISNRMFDAVASGARIISDYVPGSSEIFGEALLEFRDVTELEDLLSSDMTSKFGSQIRIDEIASSIQREHNFDQRAQVLLNEASDFINLKN